jgi:hypothetical protein
LPSARQRQVEHEQRKLDDALRDSFPASDPISFLEPCPADKTLARSPDDRRDPAGSRASRD